MGKAVSALFVILFSNSHSQTSFHFDFGPGPVQTGYTQVIATTTFNATRGYGWDFGLTVTCADRGGADSLRRDVCFLPGYSYFSVNLPEGNYDVSVILGDAGAASTTTLKVESRRLVVEKAQNAAGQFSTHTFTLNRRNTAISTGGTVGVTARELGGLNWDGNKLTFEFNNSRASVAAMDITPSVNPVQVFLAGNSTVCDWATETEAAWGQMFPRFLRQGAVVVSLAEAGLTGSSFIAQRRLDKITSLMRTGDYLFAEFAHNDMGSLTLAQYQANLVTFISRARTAGGTPVLVTPTPRRSFSGNTAVNTFVNANGDYLAAMKQTATSNNAALIDLNACATRFIETLGPTNSALAYWLNGTTQDNTHFNNYGAYEIARCVVEGIRTGLPALAAYLTTDIGAFNPSTPDPTSWSLPQSADTSVWHYNATGINGGAVRKFDLLSVDREQSILTFNAEQKGRAEFFLYALDGRKITGMRREVEAGRGTMNWKALGTVPRGIYFLSMQINGMDQGSIRFCRM